MAPPKDGTELSVGTTMVASSIAGFASRIPCHPIDTCKARMQVSKAKQGFFAVARQTLQMDGFRGLYSGLGVTLFAGPALCLYLTTYEVSVDAMGRTKALDGVPRFAKDLTGGLVAEAVSCVMWVPIDVLKERMQVQSLSAHGRKYFGTFHGLARIFREEGLGGIYKGYGATLASFGPYSAFHLAFYQQLKQVALDRTRGTTVTTQGSATPQGTDPQQEKLPFLLNLVVGAAAGAAAGWLTSPLDMAKLRIQVERAARARQQAGGQEVGQAAAFGFNYTSVFGGVRTIMREEGLTALWKGAMARCGFMAPYSAISLSTFEWLKWHLQNGTFS